uniref:Cell cycle checkpoint protein RAD1 n=1 Tax=Spongospora subterranea TaxID=70186 RepID=A0A0H5R4M4_9EUKA|eukprot:CRZ03024.1 hypothetical protein [Spongospora subterranea]
MYSTQLHRTMKLFLKMSRLKLNIDFLKDINICWGSFQARAYIKKESLQDYELLADHVQITINLSLMYRCLTVFGDKSAHVEFLYRGDGFPITFILEDQGVITECQINTLEPVSLPDFNFRSSSVINRAIIKSSLLKEALSDMDIPGSQYIDITMSPVHPFIKLASNAGAMRSEVQFLNDPEVFPVLACQTTASFPYALPLFRSTVKALSMATQTNIKMNTEGMLLLQHSIKSLENTNIKNWIEFTLSPAIMERDAVDLQR